MGNNESRVVVQEDFQEELHEIQSPIYGEAKIIRNNKTKQLLAQKLLYCSNEEELQQLHEHIRHSKAVTSEYILSIYNDAVVKNQGFCHSIANAYIYIEYIQTDIRQLITELQKEIQIFSENMIIQMIHDIVLGLKALKSIGGFHQNIQPRTILHEYSGKFKISYINFIVQQNNYNNLLQQIDGPKDCFIPPESFKQLGEKVIIPSIDLEKNEIFSLGLTALAMALKETSMHDLYDFDKFQFNAQLLQEKLGKLDANYSQNFKGILNKMLEIQTENRFDLQITYNSCLVLIQKCIQEKEEKQLKQQTLASPKIQNSITNTYMSQSKRLNTSIQNVKDNIDLPLKIEDNRLSKEKYNNLNISLQNHVTMTNENQDDDDMLFKGRSSGIKSFKKISPKNKKKQKNKQKPLNLQTKLDIYQDQQENLIYYPKRYTLQPSQPIKDLTKLEALNKKYTNQSQIQSTQLNREQGLNLCIESIENHYRQAINQSNISQKKFNQTGIQLFTQELIANQNIDLNNSYYHYLYPQSARNHLIVQSSYYHQPYLQNYSKNYEPLIDTSSTTKNQKKQRWKL